MTESELEAQATCPDCRCVLTRQNGLAMASGTGYCRYCLLERALAGERVRIKVNPDETPWFVTLCQKCGGTGEFLVTARQEGTDCYRCFGEGLIAVDKAGTQRTARWSETFQKNRRPPEQRVAGAPA